jgi:predicted enzyme related to lactoylglutathione lyase
MNRFFHYQLRTTDVPAAKAFYASLLGEGVADIEPLPKQAIEHGAPAHWLGHIGVDDVEQAARAFAERGATQLGPVVPARGGGKVAVFRDPGGAVVALASRTTANHPSPKPDVIWHQLHAGNVSQTASTYCDLFGWHVAGQRDHGEHGVHREFAWGPGDPCIGSAVDVAGRSGVHSHWLFHFQVPSLEAAVAKVRSAGGVVLEPTKLENGDRLAMCEDPQGAAFMLHATS